MSESALVDGFDNVCKRWGVEDRRAILAGPDEQKTMAKVFGISMLLGGVFDDSADAEMQWINSPRQDLKGSPLLHMLEKGDRGVDNVAEVVNELCGLR